MNTGGALQDVKVVELGNGISAPYCGKLLADLGSEVIKVEKPQEGDESRRHGPFLADIPGMERSGLYLNLNTSKLGITLDALKPTGRLILLELLKHADVFLENNPPGVMEQLGLDYTSLAKINPRLVVTSITPYGWSGPYRNFKGHDINILAFGGVSHSLGEPDREPLIPPLGQGDYQAALSAAAGTMLALLARETTGKGQHVDIAAYEIWATIHQGAAVTTYVYIGSTGRRQGRTRGDLYPYTILPCKDGYTCLIAREGRQWKRFLVEVMGRPDIADNPRYRDRRVVGEKLHEEMDNLLKPWFMEHTKAEIFALCREHGVPFAPVQNIAEVVNDVHLRERGFFVEASHPTAGTLTYPGAPFRLSQTPWRIRGPAPMLGQHNEDIYGKRLGYAPQQLAELAQAGII